jgi:hypothetical protein
VNCRLRVRMWRIIVVFIYVNGVRLSLHTLATNWRIVDPLVIHEYGELRWNDTDRKNQDNSENTCPSAIFDSINPTCTEPAQTQDSALRGRRLPALAMARPLVQFVDLSSISLVLHTITLLRCLLRLF